MKRWILLAWVLALGVAAAAIGTKEHLLARGDTLYLRLAPVDPRSLMQGDYMALNFAIADAIRAARERQGLPAEREQVAVVRRDAHGEASLVRLHTAGAPLAAGEQLLRFQTVPSRWGGVQVQVSTDAYFFQEGHGARFGKARYGEFRVGPQGQALLVGLRDENLQPL
ncbi:GDYXXLXY domain-containing protein [Cupriavidus sp. 2TAF22]|uniref:GDYXXLXY domain-containing protein n=1 Tax=unclassified Cupriavidus TaxID=2640874 RepID=UPI003F90ECD2